jgi:hypothetical protein
MREMASFIDYVIDLAKYRHASILIDSKLNSNDLRHAYQIPDGFPEFVYQFFYNLTQLTGDVDADEQITKELYNYLLLSLGCDQKQSNIYSRYEVHIHYF